jgi:hypothetical protein
MAFHKNLSPSQQFWLHKLAMPKVAVVPAATIDLSGITALFAKAATALKKPAVILSTPEGVKVKVAFAGSSSKFVGNLMVSGPVFGGAYYGRVTPAGEFFAGRDKNPGVVTLLKDFAANPAKVAAEYGHNTGCCCFCSRGLDDDRSVSVGYGPICAKRYGLPWGATPANEVAQPENLEPAVAPTPAVRNSYVNIGVGFAPVHRSLLNDMAEDIAEEASLAALQA